MRKALKQSQAVIAARAGVSQQTYAGWERRTKAIEPDKLAQLAVALETNMKALLGQDPSAVPQLPAGRARRLLLAVSQLPSPDQKRILDVVEDLLSATQAKK